MFFSQEKNTRKVLELAFSSLGSFTDQWFFHSWLAWCVFLAVAAGGFSRGTNNKEGKGYDQFIPLPSAVIYALTLPVLLWESTRPA